MKFLISIILVLLAIGMVIALGIIEKENGINTFKLNKRQLLAIIPLLVALGMNCITFVSANTVGVKYSAFNGTSKETLNEGLHFKTPFDKIYEIDTTVQERSVKNVMVQTNDAQFLTMNINVKYQVTTKDAFKVYKGYKTLDILNKNIIANYAQQALSEVCTQYNIIDILGDKRNEVIQKSSELLKEKYANEGVTFKSLTVKDMDAGNEIEKAIKDEAVAKKEVETAEQKKQKAQKEAETKLIEAQGEAEANAAKSTQLTDQILKEKIIEKWNGELSKVGGSNGTMFDISSLLD
ncbi:prohibitin family protein [Faecalibacillus intestinalis]|uniref:prohibitin family protein n=1 Tax=Faecalibacillus intestinalis TaxID=1982626 RepID=UPI0022E6B39D|nr:prohibitin family protein [Faecalibacillus intestinalis]